MLPINYHCCCQAHLFHFFSTDRSNDGHLFEIIAVLNGAGNSTIPQNYSWTEQSKSEQLKYYRLSQFDFDGEQKILNTIAANCSEISVLSILSLNYADESLTLNLENNKTGLYTIELADYSGKSILSFEKQLESGMNRIDIYDVKISSGFYFIRVNNSSETAVQKVGLFN